MDHVGLYEILGVNENKHLLHYELDCSILGNLIVYIVEN